MKALRRIERLLLEMQQLTRWLAIKFLVSLPPVLEPEAGAGGGAVRGASVGTGLMS